MKIKKLLPIFILSFFLNINLIAQSNFEIPADNKLLTKQDSIKMGKDVIEAAKWIITTDLDKEEVKRKAVNGFVLKWYIDNIGLNMSLVEKLSEMNEGNSDLLLVYFAGASKYFIENKPSKNGFEATKAGLLSVIEVYKKGIGITKSKGLEDLTKLKEENKLDQYIKNNF